MNNTRCGFTESFHSLEFEQCESTNDYLKENSGLIKESRPVAVSSLSQSHGRGRETREWVSVPGRGLYISFGYRFPLQPSLNLLSLVAGIAVFNTVNAKLPDEEIVIKWPNDILVNEKKIAGILIENVITADELISIIGIGININHEKDEFPEEIRKIATSINVETGKPEPLDNIRCILGEELDTGIGMMLDGDTVGIISAYRQKTALLQGRVISFHDKGVKQKAVYRGVSDSGSVILEGKNGELFNSFSGELFLED